MAWKHIVTSVGALVALTGIASAGIDVAPAYSAKQPKNPLPPNIPEALGCDCFDGPSFSIDPFAAGVIIDGDGLDDSLGGGVALTSFVNSYLGFSTSVYWWDDGDSVVHSVTGSAILRYPIRSICVAPYVIGGVGGHFDSVNQLTGHLGGGIEVACPFAECLGIFADGAYYWADETDNYTVVRVGARIRW